MGNKEGDYTFTDQRRTSVPPSLVVDSSTVLLDSITEDAQGTGSSSTAFSTSFRRQDDFDPIDHVVFTNQRFVHLTLDGHADKPRHLHNLGTALFGRFRHRGEINDLTEAIVMYQRAIELAGDVFDEKAEWLSDLGEALHVRFVKTGDVEDISSAISTLEDAVRLITQNDHLIKDQWILNLGSALQARFKHGRDARDFERAKDVYRRTVEDVTVFSSARIRAAREWGNFCLEQGDNASALEAFGLAVALIPLFAWVGHQAQVRFTSTRIVGDVANEAAAAAISLGKHELALEWLEAGRNIVWEQLYELRTPVDTLRAVRADLADEFERISRELQLFSSSFDLLPSSDEEDSDESDVRRSLGLRREELLEEIRVLPGFERFLRPLTYDQLVPAAQGGPIITINVHDSRCDALILFPKRRLLHVPLPKLSAQGVNKMSSAFRREIAAAGRSTSRQPSLTEAARGFKPAAQESAAIRTLKLLWDQAVQPILYAMDLLPADGASEHRPRIIWCPTGPLSFLPLHAAGSYRRPDTGSVQLKTFDVVVSSYTPSLSAAIRTSSTRRFIHGTGLPSTGILCVSQPETPDLDPLPGAAVESECLRDLFPAGTLQRLDGPAADRVSVLTAMRMHAWVHLACHGIQDSARATDSAFALHDGMLTLSALADSKVNSDADVATSARELAFLSACQTATGDARLPDEAVHLAAGMLAVGYRAVVGTMWAIRDEHAPRVVRAFYRHVLRSLSSRDVDSDDSIQTRTAYALDAAVKELRMEIGEGNLADWVQFVHFGA